MSSSSLRCIVCQAPTDLASGSGLCSNCVSELASLDDLMTEAGTDSLLGGLLDGARLEKITPKKKVWSPEEMCSAAVSRITRQTRPEGFCVFCGATKPIELSVSTVESPNRQTPTVKFSVVPCCEDMEWHVDQMLEEAQGRLELRRRLCEDDSFE